MVDLTNVALSAELEALSDVCGPAADYAGGQDAGPVYPDDGNLANPVYDWDY